MPLGAGAQGGKRVRYWIPAFAGMTKTLDLIASDQYLTDIGGKVVLHYGNTDLFRSP